MRLLVYTGQFQKGVDYAKTQKPMSLGIELLKFILSEIPDPACHKDDLQYCNDALKILEGKSNS